ncbi:uncharacterized protein [Parasteatoda tepidariorum]|uniref:uncharacterized protein n=1 Tax=Parasteatoda tepidariorum TaxID=114398 RepID=UPI0039BCFC77
MEVISLERIIDWEKIINDASIFRIQGKFNPPTAAWWGGWWERIVQMIKRLLRRVLGKACLMYEEMSIILCDVEAVINGRPFTYISEDSKDFLPLTPSMFIQDIRAIGVPDLNHIDTANITKRWRYQQSLRDTFRKRFTDDYLSPLVQTPLKNKHLIRDLKPGDVVLISYDH